MTITQLFGSILTDDFKKHSDVDFLIIECPKKWQYAIEGYVDQIMQDIPFDVAYYEELPVEFKEKIKVNA
ncbi:MAG: nucleotidyltransferase domain-containing protein [Methylococcaceae bacterium]|nr:nucleotidyltransferase domain-containing protein [Methylococcaceae bacterium]